MDIKNRIVRPVTNTDLPKLAEFLQILVNVERPFNPTLKDGEVFYYDIEKFILDPETEFLVIEDNGEIIGCGYAQIRSAKAYEKHELFGYIGFMFVSHEFRGKGISSLLLNNLKNWILSKGITEVRLEVYDENQAAIRSYEKAGFKKLVTTMRCDIS